MPDRSRTSPVLTVLTRPAVMVPYLAVVVLVSIALFVDGRYMVGAFVLIVTAAYLSLVPTARRRNRSDA